MLINDLSKDGLLLMNSGIDRQNSLFWFQIIANIFFEMNSFDLKVLLQQKKVPIKNRHLIKSACLDNDTLIDVDFHDLVYEDISFFNVKIKDSDLSKCKFINSIFTNVRFNNSKLMGQFSNCLFLDCTFDNNEICFFTCDSSQFINCNFYEIKNLCFDSFRTNFVQCKYEKVHLKNCSYKACLFFRNDFIETTIYNSPFQNNKLYYNNFFKVKNSKANSFLALFYKNEYTKTTGFEKDLIELEKKKYFTKYGEVTDNMKNYLKHLSLRINSKKGK